MFQSEYKQLGQVDLPFFTGTRVMMMPVVLDEPSTVPIELYQYHRTVEQLFAMTPREHHGKVGYLTIDEKKIMRGDSHRLGGLHVDGIFQGRSGGWGGGGGWGTNGMITVASEPGCRAWRGTLRGWPGNDGECDHLVNQLDGPGEVFKPGVAYWLSGMCVHESMRQPRRVLRKFVRLSMPSSAPWFEGYTENPVGVLPTGPILPRRKQMDRA